jgi:anti-anti-sigma factor
VTLTLPAARDSAARARAFVRQELEDFERLDEVLLCVSELVTNAVLHAGTACEVEIDRGPRTLRVGVRDLDGGRLPQPRNFDRAAVTGRGLLVVEALTDRWGVDSDHDGKTVWFELALGDSALGLVTVRLLGLPLDLHREVAEHAEALRREFALITAAESDETIVPARLLAINDEIRDRFGGFAAASAAELTRALNERRTQIDLHFEVPAEAGAGAVALRELYDEADEYCRAGEHLLTLATPPEGVLYRQWFCGEFTSQIGGAEPLPWRTFRERVSPVRLPPTPPAAAEDTGLIRLTGVIDLETAPMVRQMLNDVIGTSGVRVRVDGSDVEFIDSVGVSALMVAHARCVAQGGSLVVEGASERLRATLESVGVADLLLATLRP